MNPTRRVVRLSPLGKGWPRAFDHPANTENLGKLQPMVAVAEPPARVSFSTATWSLSTC